MKYTLIFTPLVVLFHLGFLNNDYPSENSSLMADPILGAWLTEEAWAPKGCTRTVPDWEFYSNGTFNEREAYIAPGSKKCVEDRYGYDWKYLGNKRYWFERDDDDHIVVNISFFNNGDSFKIHMEGQEDEVVVFHRR